MFGGFSRDEEVLGILIGFGYFQRPGHDIVSVFVAWVTSMHNLSCQSHGGKLKASQVTGFIHVHNPWVHVLETELALEFRIQMLYFKILPGGSAPPNQTYLYFYSERCESLHLLGEMRNQKASCHFLSGFSVKFLVSRSFCLSVLWIRDTGLCIRPNDMTMTLVLRLTVGWGRGRVSHKGPAGSKSRPSVVFRRHSGLLGNFFYLRGYLTKCNKSRHPQGTISAKPCCLFKQWWQQEGGQDTKWRPIWKSRGWCHPFGRTVMNITEPRRRVLWTQSPVSRKHFGGESWILGFPLLTAPGLGLGTTTSAHRIPPPLQSLHSGHLSQYPTRAGSLSYPSFPSPQDWALRAPQACHSSSGILFTHL